MLKLWTSYRFSDTLSIEGTIGQVQGVFSGTVFLARRHPDRAVVDTVIGFFGVGVGKF